MFERYKFQWLSDDDENVMDGPTPTSSDTEEEENTQEEDFLKSIELGCILEQVKNIPKDPNTREEYRKYLDDVEDLVRFLKRVIWRNTKVSKLGLTRGKTVCTQDKHQTTKTKASSTTQL